MSVEPVSSRRLHLVAPPLDRLVREPPPHELGDWIDRGVVDVTGVRIGVLFDVVVDDGGRPRWLAVDDGGLDVMTVAYVPVQGASLLGECVLVAHPWPVVEAAPQPAPAEALDAVTERRLHDHYETAGRTSPRQPADLPPVPSMIAGLRIDWSTSGSGTVLVRVSGELDEANVDAARVTLDGLLDRCDEEVVLDLADLDFISCRGLDLLAHVDRRLAACGGRLHLQAASAAVRRLLDLTAEHHPACGISAWPRALRPTGRR